MIRPIFISAGLLPLVLTLAPPMLAQSQSPRHHATAGSQISAVAPGPAPLSPNLMQLQQVLAQIEQMAQQANLDIAGLRIEKWKADPRSKEQAQSNAESLRNNLSAALPGMVSSARGAPAALAPTLKLYRDLNVLYDVLSGLTESAGAFGPKDDYRNLAADTQALDSSRRALADFLEALASFKDSELARLHPPSNSSASNVNGGVPKRVIDDTEPVKPPAKKKKAAPPK